MLKDLYIVGAGGFGREVAWLAERINQVAPEWNLKGFIDDDESVQGAFKDGHPVVGGCDYLQHLPNQVWVVCAVGSAKTRKKIIEKLSQISNVSFATLIDTSVLQSNRVEVGEGSIICAGTILTVDICVGKHVIINLDCTVGHDAMVHDFVTVYPSVNISGNVSVGECTELGTGAQIIQGIKICAETTIGAGAVVVRDIDQAGTYIGVPARLKG